MKSGLRIILAVLVMGGVTIACGLTGTAPTSTPEVITVVVTAVPSEVATVTVPTEPSTPEPGATPGPQCIVQKELNFRSGPGTGYNPPLRALQAGTVLIPTGYNPVGSPAGDWVQVTDPQNNQIGWVNAGAEFVRCSIDLTSLPSVAVQPPPTPAAPQVSNKPPQGPQGGDIQFDIVMSPVYLMQIMAKIDGTANNGDGIDTVTFIIERNGETVYEAEEANAAFCIFKGGEPDCNPWPESNGRYSWGENGPVVETGDYLATIRITRDSDNREFAQWTFSFTVDLP